MSYDERLFKFLNELVPKILGKGERSDKIVNLKKNRFVWKRGFTHFTYDPENNYERSEFFGDTLCKPAFCMYLVEAFDYDFSEQELTELTNVYMAKVEQANYAQQLGLSKYIRVDSNNKSELFRLYTDLFESFVGCVYETAENVALGLGYIACRQCINYLFDEDGLNINIDLNKGEGSGKTVIYQVLQRFSLGTPTEDVDYENGEIVVRIFLTPQQQRVLAAPPGAESLGIKLGSGKKDLLVGEGRGNTVKVAMYQAYTNAYYQRIRPRGINVEWANKVKSVMDLSKFPEDIQEKVKQKMKQQGIEDIQFNKPPKLETKKTVFIQLVAIRKKAQIVLGSVTILRSSTSDEYEKAKNGLINKYLKS